MNTFPRLVLLPLLSFAGLLPVASGELLFFEKVDDEASQTVSLEIEGNRVTGFQTWQPHEQDGARGYLDGVLKGDRIIATYSYTIEGSDQSQDQVFKLDGDRLLIGQGELVDPRDDGNLILKDATSVTFDTELKRVDAFEPRVGSAERKAIMDAMRGPVSRRIGQPVEFTGDLLESDGWVRFRGSVGITNGQPPKDEGAEMDLDLDFFALLQKSAGGEWLLRFSGFSGDISAREDARYEFPDAPWVLFE